MYDPIVMNLLRKAFQISDNYVLIKEQYRNLPIISDGNFKRISKFIKIDYKRIRL